MTQTATQVRTVMAGFIPAVALLLSAAPADADLKLCNRMSYVIEAAIGIDYKAATATRGWFRIDPAACRMVVQGTLTADRILLNARALGVYGSSPIPQNGGDTLCIAPDNFVIAAARQCRSGQSPAPFTQITPPPADAGKPGLFVIIFAVLGKIRHQIAVIGRRRGDLGLSLIHI